MPSPSLRRTPVALRPASLVMIGALGLATAVWAGCGARSSRRPITSPGAGNGTDHGTATVPDGDGLAPDEAPSGTAVVTGVTPSITDPPPGRPIKMTLYHVASQPCPDSSQVPLPKCGGGSLGMVSHAFKKSLAMQGTGKLCDGRLVGVQTVAPLCFVVVDAKYPWGLTASGHAATPFRSLGVRPKVMPYGSWYYVRELDGVTLPFPQEGKKHDGCLRADDTGNGIGDNHVDLFVGPKSAMTPLVGIVDRPVTISPGAGICTGKEDF
jgi:3D (Asp-Asp-Asp) domain-containing protein